LDKSEIRVGEKRYLERAAALSSSYAQAASAQTTERAYGADFADFSA
jgi:hypothetical protein